MQFRKEIICAHRNNNNNNNNNSGRNDAGGIATRSGLQDLGLEIQLGRNFVYKSIPALGPSQPPAQWVPGHFTGDKGAKA